MSFMGLSSAATRLELSFPQRLQRWMMAHSPPLRTQTATGSMMPPQAFQRFWPPGANAAGAFFFYSPDRRFIYKILRSSCIRSSITMGFDKKPFMPLSKALRRSSSKALAVMARIGSFARAGSSSARIFRVAV